jgi:hypothetical protein
MHVTKKKKKKTAEAFLLSSTRMTQLMRMSGMMPTG